MRFTAVLTLFFMFMPPAVFARETITFALTSAEPEEALKKYWPAFFSDMSASIGHPVVSLFSPDYAGAIWALSSNKAQIAHLGNRSAIEAVDRADSEVVVQSIDRSGEPGYYSYLITQAGSALNNDADVIRQANQLHFGFGDINSTSGFTIPSYYLFTSKNIEAKNIFKQLSNASHEANFLGVAEHKIDVATSNSQYLPIYKEQYPDKYKEIKVIWKSPIIPSDPFVFRKDMPDQTRKAIVGFLLTYGQATPGKSPEKLRSERETLNGLSFSGFRLSSNEQLKPVRIIELHRQRQALRENVSISDEVKKQRLLDINIKLSQETGCKIQENGDCL